jgi:hypothetical protein
LNLSLYDRAHDRKPAEAASHESERAILDGAKALAMTALAFLCDGGLRAQAADALAGEPA